MITGASQADAAVLIVDAKEGIKEQTKRHAYILSMLGLKQIAVAINKMDLVDYEEKRFNEVKTDLLKFLSSLKINPSYVVPMSAMNGGNIANKYENLKWYNGPTLLEALDNFKNKVDVEGLPLRFPIQDVYKFDDKRILVGRIESGKISVGQEVLFLPSNKKCRIKSIEVFQENRKSADAGECIGVMLEDPLFIERGEVVCNLNSSPKNTTELTAKVFWLSNDSLKKGEKITIKCATQEIEGKVSSINAKYNSSSLEKLGENVSDLSNNEVGEIKFSLSKPIVYEDFNEIEELGRFVIVKGYDVSAGGIITTN